MLNFLFAFLLKISEILKARISRTETDINKRVFGFQRSFILTNKKLSKISMYRHLKVDCSEIFKPKKFGFAAKFLIYGLDQKLSSCEH